MRPYTRPNSCGRLCSSPPSPRLRRARLSETRKTSPGLPGWSETLVVYSVRAVSRSIGSCARGRPASRGLRRATPSSPDCAENALTSQYSVLTINQRHRQARFREGSQGISRSPPSPRHLPARRTPAASRRTRPLHRSSRSDPCMPCSSSASRFTSTGRRSYMTGPSLRRRSLRIGACAAAIGEIGRAHV